MSEQQDLKGEEWMRVTLSSIGDAVITTDSESQVTFLNPVAESLTGWTQADAYNQPLEAVFKIVNQDTRAAVESPSVRALRDGVIVGLANHTLLISNDGTERPIDDSAAPIRNENGEVAGVVLVFRDITERYKQERQIQEALNYAQSIITTLREPFLVINGDLKVHTANRAFYEHFNVTPQETEDCYIYELGSGQWDIPGLRDLLDQVMRNSEPVLDFEVEHDFPTIGRRCMLLNALRIRRSGDHPNLLLVGIEDITERKRAEVALKISEIRYRRLFEAAKDGILILDAETGIINDANPFMEELLGFPHAHFMGKELWEVSMFSDKSANEAAIREVQQNGYIRYEHLPLRSQGGTEVEVEVVANVYQEGPTPVIQCNIRDITARSRMERQLQEQTVALADLHRRKDEFLAMLSHELRSPLAPISNALQLLRLTKNEDPIQRQSRTIIERQVGQLTLLIDDLLEVSRVTTGRIHLHEERLDLNGVVEHALESVRPLIDHRRQVLTLDTSPDPIWLDGDGARLEQVVVNLLTNAAKYTEEEGHILLAVKQEGEEAVVRVRDSGVGIAPEFLPRIFDLFTQSERSLDRAQGGLGIGLSLVQRLVELHKGRVEAHSSLGQGSEFVVRLPALTNATTHPTLPVEVDTPVIPPLRVLVVDDNVDAAQTLALLLQASGHVARTAYDGPSALAQALDYRPHVVLLDIGLPGMNGFEVATRLRQHPEIADVVLVALTGYGQEADRQRSREAGFDRYLVKPADFKQIQEILAAVKPT